MNTDELVKRIHLGEDSFTEFKAVKFSGSKISGPKQNDLADEIAAFANSKSGGVILLGVSDKKQVEGIPIEVLAQVEELIRNACYDSIKPMCIAESKHVTLPDKDGTEKIIVVVNITPSLFVHQSPGGYLIRIGDAKKPIAPDILARLFQIRSQTRIIPFDEQPVPHSSLADLSFKDAEHFFPKGKEIANNVLIKMGLLTHDNNEEKATVGGILLFGKEPQYFLPNSIIHCVRYKGTSKQDSIITEDFIANGTLFKQIDEAIKFVLRSMTIVAVKSPHRVEHPQFAREAIFEAIVNAVAHRDYSIYGAKIRIFIFDDRMEILSPGALPNSLTVDSLDVRQFSRNELLTRFLGRASPRGLSEFPYKKYMETRGDGVPIILELSEKLSGKRPMYVLFDDELRLTIWGNPKAKF